MKKLLFILEHLNIGGAERSLVDILNHLDYSRYEVDLLLYQGKGDYEAEIPPQVNILYYPTDDAFGRITTVFFNAIKNRDWFSLRFRYCFSMTRLFGDGFIMRTRKLFRESEKEYDCAISCRPGIINNLLLVYVFKSKKRTVWWHHGEMAIEESARKRLMQMYQQIDTMVSVSDYCIDIIKENFGIDDERIAVIPNMICADRIIKQSREFEIPIGGKPILCSAGRISHEKNILVCPEIGNNLRQAGIDFIWYIVGDGYQSDTLKEKIIGYGLEDNFELTGSVTNPYPYVAAADVFVHPSLVESQGIAILEAMALKTPVVVVNSGGPREYIQSGVNGYLVNNDVDEICGAVQKVLNSADNNKALIENAYQTALEYSPEKIVPLLDRLFSS